jgi:thiosulfate dehydrogenase (quinone) large subunit
MNIKKIVWLKLRIVMALIFLWAFVDKTFGLGFATKSESAWINGGSPTSGYLTHAVKGPFAEFFQSLSGLVWIDWVFMIGLLFIGLTFLTKKFILWGAIAGAVMMILMWLSTFPPDNNPLLDDHIVYAIVLILIALENKKIVSKKANIKRQ